MRLVRWAVFTAVAVVVCGAAWLRDMWRRSWAWRAGLCCREGVESGRAAQPQGRRGRANPGGPVPVIATIVAPSRCRSSSKPSARCRRSPRSSSVAHRQPAPEGQCRGGRAGQGRRPAVRAELPHAPGAAGADRGADPKGPGAGRAGQARFLARRQSAHQGRRDGGDARHNVTNQRALEAQLDPTRRCARTS